MDWSSLLIGQTHLQQQLQNLLQHNRLSHALLFVGKEGSGALPLAIWFAATIVSKQKPGALVEDLFGGKSALPTINEEEALAAKHRAEQLIHPDLHLSFPVIPNKAGSKPISADYINEFRDFVKEQPYSNAYDWLQIINAENKQGNITAEECNDIIKKLSLKTYEAEYKVLVMWMPEYLGKEGNKLLKLIEEPPANTVFILVAENEDAILPTIVSRCQHINVPLPQKKDIYNALINTYQANETLANQVANLCEGNVREALQLLQHSQENWMPLVNEWLRVIIRRLYTDELKFIEDIAKLGREKQKQFLRYFNHLIEQSIKAAILPKEQMAITDEEYEFTQRLLKVGGVAQLQSLINEIDNAIYYIERNANAKLLFQALGIKLFHILVHKQEVSVG